MLLSQFSFNLPQELIASSPAVPRDSARLLVVNEGISDFNISDLPSFLKKNDVIVFNDTKVIPARLSGRKNSENSANIQITLHKCLTESSWLAFAKPARKLSANDVFQISPEFYARVLSKNEGEVTLEFNVSGDDFYCLLNKYGLPPLPPYIAKQNAQIAPKDVNDYQTIYARNKGAVAAPTAGLHFTEKLMANMLEKGVNFEFVTLHVGAGTFLPVKVTNILEHKMHAEYGLITAEAAYRINEAKAKGGRIIAIGTTSLRLLESATDENGVVQPFAAETSIFITPGYKFKAVDMLLTNFHIPKSTLFMLVAAFCGLEAMQRAYKHAIENKYRFYSYGDACLLYPAN